MTQIIWKYWGLSPPSVTMGIEKDPNSKAFIHGSLQNFFSTFVLNSKDLKLIFHCYDDIGRKFWVRSCLIFKCYNSDFLCINRYPIYCPKFLILVSRIIFNDFRKVIYHIFAGTTHQKNYYIDVLFLFKFKISCNLM